MVRNFNDLPLTPAMHETIARAGYFTPTPIQTQAIGPILEGRDLIGCAQTGTGKTAAFVIPTVELLVGADSRLAKLGGAGPRVLVLAPTRELALQIAQTFDLLGAAQGVRTLVLIGGESMGPQLAGLHKRPDVIVGTPGRLFDHLERRSLVLGTVRTVVLDEADRMLDMGFAPQVERILRVTPLDRQTLCFSATMPREVETLDGFRNGRYRVLIATDIAARGIDVPEIAHVVNFDMPHTAEDYIHRIGRTARAEASGRASSFASPEEHEHLRVIERHLGHQVPQH